MKFIDLSFMERFIAYAVYLIPLYIISLSIYLLNFIVKSQKFSKLEMRKLKRVCFLYLIASLGTAYLYASVKLDIGLGKPNRTVVGMIVIFLISALWILLKRRRPIHENAAQERT